VQTREGLVVFGTLNISTAAKSVAGPGTSAPISVVEGPAPDFALSDCKETHGLTSSRRQVRRPKRLDFVEEAKMGCVEPPPGAVTSRTGRARELQALSSRHVEFSSYRASNGCDVIVKR
jgi:hypothetical protein